MAQPEKKQFQLERMILFSDAVFAIAITLLVIELRVPLLDVHHVTEASFWEAFSALLPKIIGFIVSFFMIGLYWTVHHRTCGFLVDYDSKLLWLNLIFLFSIVLVPFSTAVYSEYSLPEYIHLVSPFAIYVFNICFISFMNVWMVSYITNPKNKLAENLPSVIDIRNNKARSIAVAGVFLISLIVSFWQAGVGRMFLLLIPFAIKLAIKKEKV